MTTPSGGGNGGGWYPNQIPIGAQQTPQHHQVYSGYGSAGYSAPAGTRTPINTHPGASPARWAPSPSPMRTNSMQRTPGHYPVTPHTPGPMNPVAPEVHTVLIALAETSFTAAYTNGYDTALGTLLDAHAYCKLIATGLGCLEAALQYRLQPRVEAMVRLRYATVLFEETDNLEEAEETLNKGIILAGRNNLTDIKYTMQHLLTRIIFRTSPKAAMKQLETYISDSETLDMHLWSYTFRFLRFSLFIEPSLIHDDQLAISALQKIGGLSRSRRDVAITALSSIMEAMLSLLPGVEGVESAQRALANAYTQQNSGVALPPQIEIMIQLLDIVCSLMKGKSNDSELKIRKLHGMLDRAAEWTSWREDGEFEVTVNSNRQGRPQEHLKFQWLNKDELISLGYLLSGLAKFQRNIDESGKGELFLSEGTKTADRITDELKKTHISMAAAKRKILWKKQLKCYMWVYHCFLLCARTDWDNSLRLFKSIDDLARTLESEGTPLGELKIYLHAIICHGTNDLYNACNLYAQLYNSLPSDSELSIISKLNSILILRIHDEQQVEPLMASLEKLCPQHKNENIRAAYITVKATERGELVKTKNYLSLALKYASTAANQQLTFLVLSFMYSRFFAGVVSEQAEKSAKAAMQNAKKGRDSLWTLMGGEMVADCLSRKGNIGEAERQRQKNAEVRTIVIRNLTRGGSRLPQQQP